MINKNSEVPCYSQLSEILLGQIRTGAFPPGMKLPKEIAISKKYKLNRHTVRRAIDKLEAEGLIYKIKGKGTFLAKTKIPYNVSKKTQFTTSILQAGLQPDARLLDMYEITAGVEFSDRLKIQPAEKVSVLEILRYADGIPFSHTTSFLSAQKFPCIHNLLNRDRSFSLYQLLEEHYGIEATRKSSRFEVAMPDDRDMESLQISPKTPLLVVKSLSESPDGEIVEYCLSKFRGDLCSITVDFNDLRG